jgi:hypothetical protein
VVNLVVLKISTTRINTYSIRGAWPTRSWMCDQLFPCLATITTVIQLMASSSQVLFYVVLFVQVSWRKWFGDKEIEQDRVRIDYIVCVAPHPWIGQLSRNLILRALPYYVYYYTVPEGESKHSHTKNIFIVSMANCQPIPYFVCSIEAQILRAKLVNNYHIILMKHYCVKPSAFTIQL